jgi:hypothetical protein
VDDVLMLSAQVMLYLGQIVVSHLDLGEKLLKDVPTFILNMVLVLVDYYLDLLSYLNQLSLYNEVIFIMILTYAVVLIN